MNVATVAPFGYASYLVYKIGGGFDYMDTTVALGFYGGTIAASLAMVSIFNCIIIQNLFRVCLFTIEMSNR
jgi:hypothetical protein